jgi:hypothetical protein
VSVVIGRGQTLSFPPGSLTLSRDRNVGLAPGPGPEVSFDTWFIWLEVAIEHLQDARKRQEARKIAWAEPDSLARASTLEAEFKASMQAIVASAIALDALYASVKLKIDPKATVGQHPKRKRTRFAKIAETLKLAFRLPHKEFGPLRSKMEGLFDLRDLAVHPSAEFREVIVHPELQVGVERRFVDYRYQNAAATVDAAVRIIRELVNSQKTHNEAVRKYAEALRPTIEALILALTEVQGASK